MLTILEVCFWFHFVAKKLSLLKHGRIDIVQCLRDLPKTRHHPGAFSVDVIRATVSSVWPTSLSVLKRICFFFCGKLSREIFCEFRGFLAICESFLHKIWGRGIFWWHKRTTRGSFLCENHFLPRKFPTERLQIHHNCTPILCYDSLSCDNLVHFVRECIFLLAPLCSPSSFFVPSPPFCSPSSFLFPSPDYCWHCP